MTDQDLLEPQAASGARVPGGLDRTMMRRAIELAGGGWGRVAPNPLVGAVVAGDRGIAGEGFHAEYGHEHAEVRALREAGDASRGGTLYVTLEPCAHHGKTPPCVDAIIESGIRRVVVACRDPNPEAEGGINRLVAAGIDVASGVEAEAAARQNAAFLWHQRTGRPFVTLKLASSLDGRIAARPGVRTAMSGPTAGRWVQRLRAGNEAILVGRVTAEVDDPLLTVRGESPRRPPVRVVLDPDARLSPRSRLVASAGEAPVWVAVSSGAPLAARQALEAAGVRLVELGLAAPHRLDLAALLEAMADAGLTSLLVEGGGQVAASFLAADLVQRMHLVYSPVLLGPDGVPAFGTSAPGVPLRLVSHEALGDDAMLEYEPPGLSSPSVEPREEE